MRFVLLKIEENRTGIYFKFFEIEYVWILDKWI